jgi:peptidoglycan/xylan/chitin deacetylase (PgdA/CDA1 family)
MRDLAVAARLLGGMVRSPPPIDQLAARLTNRLIRATPRQIIQVPTREPIVSFTFDDVPNSALSAGAAILEAHGVHGTFYISGGLEGRVEPDRTLIDAAGCKELAARGHEIGCHTYSHRDLRHVDRSFLAADLARNERYLNTVDPRSGRRNFAYPYSSGSFSKRAMLADAFRTCRAAGEAINRGTTDPTFLQSVEIRQSDATRWIDALVAAPGWLLFVTHDISPTPTPHGCTARVLEGLVAHAVERGCRVLTVNAALDRMGLRVEAR